MSTSPRAATVRALADAFNANDVAAALPYLTDDVQWVSSPAFTGGGRVFEGHEGVREWRAMLEDGALGLEVAVEELIEQGDRVLATMRVRARGASSGADMESRMYDVYEFRGGRVARREMYFDHGEALAAAGLA